MCVTRVTIHTHAGFRIHLRLFSVNCNDDAHKMPKNRHFGAGSDTMQQVHGAGVKNNNLHPVHNMITLRTHGIENNALLFYISPILRNLLLLPLQFRGHKTELIAKRF